jgi:hypothetical protein
LRESDRAALARAGHGAHPLRQRLLVRLVRALQQQEDDGAEKQQLEQKVACGEA